MFFSIEIISVSSPEPNPEFPTICSSQSISITDNDMGADAIIIIILMLIVFDHILFLLIKVSFDSILAAHYLKK